MAVAAMSSPSAASWKAVPSAAVCAAVARHSRPGAPRRPSAQAMAATSSATRSAPTAIQPHGVSFSEVGVAVDAAAVVTVSDGVVVVGGSVVVVSVVVSVVARWALWWYLAGLW